jgi:hypothetical protein
VSSIPAVLAALVALAESTLNSDEWQVLNGTRNSVTVTKDRMLAVGDGDIVGTAEPEIPALDSEDYMVPLSATVSFPGTDQTLADAEAIEAYEAVRDAVRASNKLGLVAQGVFMVFPAGEIRMQRQADENGRHTSVRFEVRVKAHTPS